VGVEAFKKGKIKWGILINAKRLMSSKMRSRINFTPWKTKKPREAHTWEEAMSEAQIQEDTQSAKKIRRWAWIAIGVASVLPMLTIIESDSLAFKAGQHIAYLLFGVGFVGFITSLVFKKSTEEVKAKTSLTIGILAITYSAFTSLQWVNEIKEFRVSAVSFAKAVQEAEAQPVTSTEQPIQTASQADSVKAIDTSKSAIVRMMDGISGNKKEQIARLKALQVKESQINTGEILKPETLVNAQAIASAQKELKKFSELIADREFIYSDYVNKTMKVMGSVGLTSNEKRDAIAGFNEIWLPQKKIMENISKAQRAVINSSTKIINLCEVNLGKFQVQNGQIMFQTQEQLTLYQTEMAKIQQAAQDESKASDAYQQMVIQSSQRMEKDLQKLQK
jgi:hypothetical protein